MKSTTKKIIFMIMLMLCANLLIATTALAASKKAMPEGMIVDEDQWNAWEVSGRCSWSLFTDMGRKELDFSYSLPLGQDSDHKKVTFSFKDRDGETLKNTEMYYCVDSGDMMYVGLWTPDKSVFKSKNFKEACIRLMLAYNSHYDRETEKDVSNITRKRAEEVVTYCLDNVDHCLVDDMRIRVTRCAEDNMYCFHMEY